LAAQEGIRSLIVMNGQFYSGETLEPRQINFTPDRKQAVEVDERRARYIVRNILGWFMAKNFPLQRLEIIRASGKVEHVGSDANNSRYLAGVGIGGKRDVQVPDNVQG